jgi:hypothetical protein
MDAYIMSIYIYECHTSQGQTRPRPHLGLFRLRINEGRQQDECNGGVVCGAALWMLLNLCSLYALYMFLYLFPSFPL